MKLEDFVCSAPPTINLSGVNACMKEIDLLAPVDFYLKSSRELIQYGTSARLAELNRLGGLLLLGLISSVEGYFRSVLSTVLDICPVSRTTAAEKQINLGGILWHGKDQFRRSAFEHMSFASAKDLVTASKGYLGFDMKGSVFNSVLRDFDTVCHLRHGLIHNAGILPGRNAIQIDIKSFSKPVEICIDYAFLQNAAAILESFVFTFNRALFSEMCARWAEPWPARLDWNALSEKDRFLEIWNVFVSRIELEARPDKAELTFENCIAHVRSEYNL